MLLGSEVAGADRRDLFDELVAMLWRPEPLRGRPAAATPAPAPPRDAIVLDRDEAWFPPPQRRLTGTRAVLLLAAAAVLGFGFVGGSRVHDRLRPERAEIAQTIATHAVVDRIIRAESNGDWNARNKRSSAAGGGQFLDGTWLDMIRAHRPDLARLGEKQALELRFDPALAREMTMRFAERNAAMLSARGLPVTPGTLYLSHFAGGGGAVALLSAPGHLDAATVMAFADASGQTTREKIVKANPFLDGFTVADLRKWGERKMEAPGRAEPLQRSASR
jgi:hypothetical protein